MVSAAHSTPVFLLNGAAASTALWNRALLYGDGLFETMLWVDGKAALWPWHWRRLSLGCERLGLAVPEPEQILAECTQILAMAESDVTIPATSAADGTADIPRRHVLRLTVYRDSQGTRGYAPAGITQTQRILTLHPVPPLTPAPLRLGLSSVRLARQPLLAGLKHLNRLEQVLAAAECERNQWDEALMLDADGQVISAVMGNILLRLGADTERDSGEIWVTPALTHCGIAGVTRQWLLEHSPVPLIERAVAQAELEQLRELWVINSVRGARPVALLQDRELQRSATGEAIAQAVARQLRHA